MNHQLGGMSIPGMSQLAQINPISHRMSELNPLNPIGPMSQMVGGMSIPGGMMNDSLDQDQLLNAHGLEHDLSHVPQSHSENEVEAATALALTPRRAKYSKEQHCYKKTALPESDKELFYRIMMPLRVYVAQKLKLPYDITTNEDYKDKLNMQEKFLVRDAVYDNLQFIDDFMAENPYSLSKEDLLIIDSWKRYFYRGTYIVERHLQKGTIFITQEKDEDEKVFLVHGLETPLVEMLPKHVLPMVIRTVLLPFKGKIIYDGLFKEAPPILGSHISRSLKEAYMRAKQQDSIITTLAPDDFDNQRKRKRKKKEDEDEVDLKKTAMEIQNNAMLLKKAAPKGIESSVCSVLCMTAQLVNKVLENPKDRANLAKSVRSLTTALNRFAEPPALLDRAHGELP